MKESRLGDMPPVSRILPEALRGKAASSPALSGKMSLARLQCCDLMVLSLSFLKLYPLLCQNLHF